MPDDTTPKEENTPDNITDWLPRGTRLHPDDAKAWDERMVTDRLKTAEVIRLFCRRYIRDPEVRKQFS